MEKTTPEQHIKCVVVIVVVSSLSSYVELNFQAAVTHGGG